MLFYFLFLIIFFSRLKLFLFKVFVNLVIGASCFLKQQRMSHENGVQSAGKLKIVDNPEYPENEFLRAGREFDIRLRHSSITYPDDAMKQFRAVAIKFADSRFHSPLDIKMNTGRTAIFFNGSSFWYFIKVFSAGKRDNYKKFFNKYPGSTDRANDAYRMNPSSFSQLYYHMRNPLGFKSKDGKARYCKFRVIPYDRGPESGLLDSEARKAPWDPDRLPGDTRSESYLKDEFVERVNQGPVKYWLQIQIHEVQAEYEEEILNSARAWDEATHPWMDCAEVTVDRILPYEESKLTHYNVGNNPDALGILPAYSMSDMRSINYLRAGNLWIQHMRLFSYKVRGMPKDFYGSTK